VDPTVAFFVAERREGVVGTSVVHPADPDLGVPGDAVYLATLVVVPEERGSGAGSALTSHVLEWAKDEGFGSVVIDWRVPNLLASRHWEAWGFRPTFHRLHRVIGVG
jgi:GNAT superfamily N-acetyltransferase